MNSSGLPGSNSTNPSFTLKNSPWITTTFPSSQRYQKPVSKLCPNQEAKESTRLMPQLIIIMLQPTIIIKAFERIQNSKTFQ
jgi:hypothetical protein